MCVYIYIYVYIDTNILEFAAVYEMHHLFASWVQWSLEHMFHLPFHPPTHKMGDPIFTWPSFLVFIATAAWLERLRIAQKLPDWKSLLKPEWRAALRADEKAAWRRVPKSVPCWRIMGSDGYGRSSVSWGPISPPLFLQKPALWYKHPPKTIVGSQESWGSQLSGIGMCWTP